MIKRSLANRLKNDARLPRDHFIVLAHALKLPLWTNWFPGHTMEELSGSIGERIVRVAQLAVAMHLARVEGAQENPSTDQPGSCDLQPLIGGTDLGITDDSRAFERN